MTPRSELRELSGLDYLQGMIEGRFDPPPMALLLGQRLISVAPGEAVFRCTPTESHLNPMGVVHGGLLCALLDSAMGVAAQTEVPASVGFTSIELKVSFLRPLPFDGQEVEARGRVLKLGRSVAFMEAHAYDSRDRLLGHATSTLMRVGE